MFYCFPVIVTLLSIHLVLFCFVQFYFRSSAFIYWPGGTLWMVVKKRLWELIIVIYLFHGWALIFFGFQSTVGADTWSVYRRYRKFRELHKTMQKSYYEVLILMFFFSSQAHSPWYYIQVYIRGEGYSLYAIQIPYTMHLPTYQPPPPPPKKKNIGPSTCKQKIHSAISPHGYESPLL